MLSEETFVSFHPPTSDHKPFHNSGLAFDLNNLSRGL